MDTVSYSTDEKIRLLRANGYVVREESVANSPREPFAFKAGRKYNIDPVFDNTVKSLLLMMNPGGAAKGEEEEEEEGGFYTQGVGIDITGPVISLSHLGLEGLVAPEEDKILFYDYSEGGLDWVNFAEATSTLKVSLNDTTPGYLENKLALSYGVNTTEILELSTISEGANEVRILQLDETKISHDKIADVSADDHHSEAHTLATTGPHTDSLPLADLAPGTAGDIITRQVSDWAVLAKGTENYVLKMGATYPAWGTVDWSELTGTQPAPVAHVLVSASHTASGLTAGHFLKALTTTTFGFAAHGLTYSDVGAAAATHYHSRFAIVDTRAVNDLPTYLDKQAELDFKTRTVIDNAPGTGIYNGLFQLYPWSDTSGGNAYQLSFGYIASTMPALGIRTADLDAGSWGPWYEISHSGNIVHAMDSATYHTSSDVTTLNATTTKHGFLKKLGGGTTNYLRADGTWAAPPGSSMTYPGAGIALSTGSAWGTSITNNSGDWNTAYGWGDHDGLYLTIASIGTDNQVPYVNSAGDGFDYTVDFVFDGSDLTMKGSILLNDVLSGIVIQSNSSNISSLVLQSGSPNVYISYEDIRDYLEIGTTSGDIYLNPASGFVGIGTDDPATELEISKANQGAILRLSNTDATMAATEYAGKLEFWKIDASGGGAGVVSSIRSVAGDAGGVFGLGFSVGSVASPKVDAFFIRYNGAVGINTIIPGYDLDVNGTGRYTGILYSNTHIYLTGAIIGQGAVYLDIYMNTSDGSDTKVTRIGGGGDVSAARGALATFYGNEHGSFPGDLYLIAGATGDIIMTGNVGIGTTAPGELLTLDGGVGSAIMWMDCAATGQAQILFGGTGGRGKGDSYIKYSDNSGDLWFGAGGSDRMWIDTGGNVSIGAGAAPSYKLDVNGTGRFTGALIVNDNTDNGWAATISQDHATGWGLKVEYDGTASVDVAFGVVSSTPQFKFLVMQNGNTLIGDNVISTSNQCEISNVVDSYANNVLKVLQNPSTEGSGNTLSVAGKTSGYAMYVINNGTGRGLYVADTLRANNYRSGDDSLGITITVDVVGTLCDDGGTIKQRSRTITIKDGLITSIGSLGAAQVIPSCPV